MPSHIGGDGHPEPDVEVLYGDYNGHMRPLGRMHFSQDSRCLVSDHPESVQEEVESHFCPCCNSLWQGTEAQAHGNRCLQCFECPCCGCVLAPFPVSPLSPGTSEYCLLCSYCRWSSQEAGLVEKEPTALVTAAFEGEKQRSAQAAFLKLLGAAKLRQREGKALSEKTSTRHRPTRSARGAAIEGPWRLTDLENMLNKKADWMTAASRNPLPPTPLSLMIHAQPGVGAGGVGAPQSVSLRESSGPEERLRVATSGQAAAGLPERVKRVLMEITPSNKAPESGETGSGSGVAESVVVAPGPIGVGHVARWPQRVKLRTQMGKRCRKDLAAGRTGILMKPCIDPLQGDASKVNVLLLLLLPLL
ncbi:unnamed protein product [Discosporangium mesarthrocarpum]